MSQQVNAVGCELRQDVLVQQLILAGDDLAALDATALQAGNERRRNRFVASQAILRQQARDTHFKEFIQIAADDTQVAQALQQRNGGIFSLCKYTPVEGNLRQFAIQINGIDRRPTSGRFFCRSLS